MNLTPRLAERDGFRYNQLVPLSTWRDVARCLATRPLKSQWIWGQRPQSLFVLEHVYVSLTYDDCRQGRPNGSVCSVSSHSALLVLSIDALYTGTWATLWSPAFNFQLWILLADSFYTAVNQLHLLPTARRTVGRRLLNFSLSPRSGGWVCTLTPADCLLSWRARHFWTRSSWQIGSMLMMAMAISIVSHVLF